MHPEPYDDDHDFYEEDRRMVFGEQEDLDAVRADMHAFEQAEQERRQWQLDTGHTHIRAQHDQFGIVYAIFDEDCAACWRDHHDRREREQRIAARRRAETAHATRWVIGLFGVIVVINLLMGWL